MIAFTGEQQSVSLAARLPTQRRDPGTEASGGNNIITTNTRAATITTTPALPIPLSPLSSPRHYPLLSSLPLPDIGIILTTTTQHVSSSPSPPKSPLPNTGRQPPAVSLLSQQLAFHSSFTKTYEGETAGKVHK